MKSIATLLKASFQSPRMPTLSTCDVPDEDIKAVSQTEAAKVEK